MTVLSPDIDKNAPKGVHYINIEGLYSEDYYKIIAGMISFRLHLNPLTAPKEFNDFFYQICNSKKWTCGCLKCESIEIRFIFINCKKHRYIENQRFPNIVGISG